MFDIGLASRYVPTCDIAWPTLVDELHIALEGDGD